MSCDDTIINVDWQFNVNVWEGEVGNAEAPFSALSSFGRFRFYDLVTEKIVLLLPDADTAAIEALAYGQRHNPAAQQSYRDCASQIGIYAFFRLVVSAAPGRPSNFADARVNISWQMANNPVSINSARNYLLSSQHVDDADAKSFFITNAMDSLMIGQHHNASVMQLYRACFRDDPDQLFSFVTSFDLTSPEETLTRITRSQERQ